VRLALRRLRTDQERLLALLEDVVAAVGKLPVVALAATTPSRVGKRKAGEMEGGEATMGVEYGE
jgi:hypothetical protein